MELRTERADGTVRMAVDGDVDLGTADRIRAAAMAALAEPGCQQLVVDLSAVTFIDSTGIGVLVDLHNAADGMAKSFALHRPSQRVVELLQLVALDTYFTTE